MDFETLRVIHNLLCAEEHSREEQYRQETKRFAEWVEKHPKTPGEAPNKVTREIVREQWDAAKHANEQFHSVLWSGTVGQ